jgi:hypothetical protein
VTPQTKVAELAGRNLMKVSLERGGKNAMIILEDADPVLAASNAAFGSWTHQGQICMATGRVLVREPLASTITDLLTQKASKSKWETQRWRKWLLGRSSPGASWSGWIPTGHSSHQTANTFYRAGGLACTR